MIISGWCSRCLVQQIPLSWPDVKMIFFGDCWEGTPATVGAMHERLHFILRWECAQHSNMVLLHVRGV